MKYLTRYQSRSKASFRINPVGDFIRFSDYLRDRQGLTRSRDNLKRIVGEVAELVKLRDGEKLSRVVASAIQYSDTGRLRRENAKLRELLEQMLNVAENADETGYVTDCGFIDLDRLHSEVRAVLKT